MVRHWCYEYDISSPNTCDNYWSRSLIHQVFTQNIGSNSYLQWHLHVIQIHSFKATMASFVLSVRIKVQGTWRLRVISTQQWCGEGGTTVNKVRKHPPDMLVWHRSSTKSSTYIFFWSVLKHGLLAIVHTVIRVVTIDSLTKLLSCTKHAVCHLVIKHYVSWYLVKVVVGLLTLRPRANWPLL